MDSRGQIERLIFLYAERIDAGDFAGVADLFADGSIKVGGAVVAAGRLPVQQMYETTTCRYEDGTPHTKHVTSNVVIEVDERARTATARSYFTVFQSLADFPLQAIIAGRYHDAFVSMSGAWQFTEREIIVELQGDLSRHLVIDIERDKPPRR